MADIPNGGRLTFSPVVTIGNLFTMIAGIVMAATLLISVTRAWDDLSTKVALLSVTVGQLQADVKELRQSISPPAVNR